MDISMPVLLRSLWQAGAASNTQAQGKLDRRLSTIPMGVDGGVARFGAGAVDQLALPDVWHELAKSGLVKSALVGSQDHGQRVMGAGVRMPVAAVAVPSRPLHTEVPVASGRGAAVPGNHDPNQPNRVARGLGSAAQFLDSRIPELDDIASREGTSNALRGAIAFGMPIARVGISAASGVLGLGQLATSQVARNRAGEAITDFLMEHPVETTQKALKDWRAKQWNEQVSDVLVAGGGAALGGGVGSKLRALDYSPHITMGPVINRFGQTGALNINVKRNPKWGAGKKKQEPATTESAETQQTYERHPQTGHLINAKVQYRPNSDHILDGTKVHVEGDPEITHYYENQGAHDPKKNRPGRGDEDYNSTKSVLPDEHVKLFKSSVPHADENGFVSRYAMDRDGHIHRFQPYTHGGDSFHWNGSTNGRTRWGEPRELKEREVPNHIKKYLKKQQGRK